MCRVTSVNKETGMIGIFIFDKIQRDSDIKTLIYKDFLLKPNEKESREYFNPNEDNINCLDYSTYGNIVHFMCKDMENPCLAKLPIFKRSISVASPDVALIARRDITKYTELTWNPN
ncbi:hypothetical protein WA158_000209 [Blastocystis sp. Blastoise]